MRSNYKESIYNGIKLYEKLKSCKDGMTVKQMAQYLDIDVRRAYRVINNIEGCGLPVYFDIEKTEGSSKPVRVWKVLK